MTPAEQPEIRPDASSRASPQRVAVIAARRDSLVALGGLVVFFAIVLGGYVGKWTWTRPDQAVASVLTRPPGRS